MDMKNGIITFLLFIIAVLVVGGGTYWWTHRPDTAAVVVPPPPPPAATTTEQKTLEDNQIVIGKSAEGRDISAYQYGTGAKKLLFVGGIHGGYEWNTVLVAYQLMDYLQANPSAVPSGVQVTIVPVLNPDGLNKVVG